MTTLMLTTPRSVVKSSTKDVSSPISEIKNQPTLHYLYLIGSEVRCNCMILGLAELKHINKRRKRNWTTQSRLER
uniref:Uncharacterized protein n=1 Tax=Hyaloperonospora arabidopsidis (strain Emoy2) TaxID=559515 RepID=M4C3D4_HYAAE